MRKHLKTVISWNSREKSFLKGEVQGVKKVKCCVESLGTGVTLPFKLRGYPKEHSTKETKLHEGGDYVYLTHCGTAQCLV